MRTNVVSHKDAWSATICGSTFTDDLCAMLLVDEMCVQVHLLVLEQLRVRIELIE